MFLLLYNDEKPVKHLNARKRPQIRVDIGFSRSRSPVANMLFERFYALYAYKSDLFGVLIEHHACSPT